jgi:hypothetical protein
MGRRMFRILLEEEVKSLADYSTALVAVEAA